MNNLSYRTTEPPSLLRKLATLIVTLAMLGLALMFGVLLFVVVLIAGAMVWGYLWWKTRELRKQMRMYPPRSAVFEGETFEGEVIEGDVIREVDSRDAR